MARHRSKDVVLLGLLNRHTNLAPLDSDLINELPIKIIILHKVHPKSEEVFQQWEGQKGQRKPGQGPKGHCEKAGGRDVGKRTRDDNDKLVEVLLVIAFFIEVKIDVGELAQTKATDFSDYVQKIVLSTTNAFREMYLAIARTDKEELKHAKRKLGISNEALAEAERTKVKEVATTHTQAVEEYKASRGVSRPYAVGDSGEAVRLGEAHSELFHLLLRLRRVSMAMVVVGSRWLALRLGELRGEDAEA
ncbi:hypothetical protein L3X38_018824 [Prunus dulcis]|uniref:Uncharacterized protein n=1 Tax=Prunus dulcis TaxID=3755 RepID=A0AAD4WBZ3_PRUDU|nr:hypothetical protein L3X38_018824 [Prunus dulcis]